MPPQSHFDRTVYLDWSTLRYAYQEQVRHSGPRRIAEFVHRTSSDRSLCLSLAHVNELLKSYNGENKEKIQEEASWLDSLNPRWIYGSPQTAKLEVRNLIASYTGVAPSKLEMPFAPSFLSCFDGMTPELSANALRDPSVRRLVVECAGNSQIVDKLREVTRLAATMPVRLKRDREDALQVFDSIDEFTQTVSKLRKERRELELQETYDALVSQRAPHLFREKNGIHSPIPFEEILSMYRTDSQHHLITKFIDMQDEAMHRTSLALVPKTIGSKSFKAHLGDVYDYWHLVGGAYCTVFTCDTRTLSAIQGLRPALGLVEALVVKPQGENYDSTIDTLWASYNSSSV